MLVFSKPSWDTLSADDQALIKKFAREAQLDERRLWNKKEAEAMAKMKAAGIEIITIADKTPFQRRGQAGLGQIRRQIRRSDQAHRGE